MGKDKPDIEQDQHGRAAPGNGQEAGVTDPPGPTEIAPEAPAAVEPARRDLRGILSKSVHFLAALFLFILAIRLMSKGADALAPRLQGTFPVDNMVSTMGLGWLGAYLVLSGSPVAAASLALFSADAITRAQTFTMLTGSRLGAAFIVLLVGFLYAMRSRTRQRRQESIGMGVLALSLTALVYIPGMLLGYGLLKSGAFDGINWHASAEVQGVIEVIWDPLRDFLASLVPGPLLFPLGLAVILASFKLLDSVLPSLDGEKHASSRRHWLRKPWPMFLLGSLAAFLTLSVSVALTILVPLASKGYIRRAEAIPYIMGANITTLADTLVAAMLLGNPVGVQVVLTEAIGVSVVTLFLLAFLYRPLQKGIMALDEWIVKSTPRLVGFVGALFVMPVALLFSGRLI
jgi:solute carrier family 34 (sodium-dependent phosphate cotransporter)